MAASIIEFLNPVAGPVGGAPSLGCIAAGVVAAGFAMWRQRRTPAPSVEPVGALDGERGNDRALVGVAGEVR